ncbi:MAG TPA: hypothetical protein VHK69_18555 [Chitinophagaceae bacterium]|jgi:hypothetical protein|nr:hypothetical protein [Chitinophagaceae bacterium]
MKPKASFWQRIGLHDWFLKKEDTGTGTAAPVLTPNDIYKYILDKFQESIRQLSFADRIVFYHEYIICFNPEDFRDFMDSKKGIFGIIVQESVRKFYDQLKGFRTQGKTVEPSASKWVFRFASQPDYQRGDIGFIGKLLPGASEQQQGNLRVTYIPRQTGIAQTFDVNPDILKGFNFYSEGYYEVPYMEELEYSEAKVPGRTAAGHARLETILPDKAFAGQKLEYIMKDEEIIVSGKEETRDASHIMKIPSEWVNTPHLRIRFNRAEGKFYLASFGEKTLVNEKEVKRSDAARPDWVELPLNSRMVLNGIVGINLFKL